MLAACPYPLHPLCLFSRASCIVCSTATFAYLMVVRVNAATATNKSCRQHSRTGKRSCRRCVHPSTPGNSPLILLYFDVLACLLGFHLRHRSLSTRDSYSTTMNSMIWASTLIQSLQIDWLLLLRFSKHLFRPARLRMVEMILELFCSQLEVERYHSRQKLTWLAHISPAAVL